jgi:Skp family chaperone for outer membrane proteins
MRLAPLAVLALLTALPLASQAKEKVSLNADEQVLIKQIQTDRRAIYADNMGLTEAESARFWPVYDEYEAKRKNVDERYVSMVNDYAEKYDTLTDAQAEKILAERMEIEKKQLELKEEYTKKMAKVLPGKKALRYAQIESRITNLLRRNLYTVIPLAR